MFSESVLNVHSLHTMKSSLSVARRQLCLWHPGTLMLWKILSNQHEGRAKSGECELCHWLANTQHAPGQGVAGQPLAYRQLLSKAYKRVCVHRPDTSGLGACKVSCYAGWHRLFPVNCYDQRPIPTPTSFKLQPQSQIFCLPAVSERQKIQKEHWTEIL